MFRSQRDLTEFLILKKSCSTIFGERPINSLEANLYSKILFRALRACSAREQIYISTKSFVCLTLQLFLSVQVTKRPLGANLFSNKTHFRALRACGAREPKQVHTLIIFAPRRFQQAIARPNPTTWCTNRYYKSPIFI